MTTCSVYGASISASSRSRSPGVAEASIAEPYCGWLNSSTSCLPSVGWSYDVIISMLLPRPDDPVLSQSRQATVCRLLRLWMTGLFPVSSIGPLVVPSKSPIVPHSPTCKNVPTTLNSHPARRLDPPAPAVCLCRQTWSIAIAEACMSGVVAAWWCRTAELVGCQSSLSGDLTTPPIVLCCT